MPPSDPPPRNLLDAEASPYLRQHAENPVAWMPWGAAAFERARAEDKPILLSVGYSACHWCHVMAHESFEDEATARDMNRWFVCVKVDREERPDVDAIYMAAVQSLTGQGGWPMTVALLPDGRPFFGGTYFPASPRFGQPPFRRVLAALADAWAHRRDEVEAAADGATRAVRAMQTAVARARPAGGAGADGDPLATVEATLDGARAALARAYDAENGGFGGAPKFPPHGALRFLLRQSGHDETEMAFATLRAMADGGIFDQLGGGFARYSVDGIWRVPHFEKMLYDNAQLLGAYADAFARTGEPRFREVALATAAFLDAELGAPGGAFYSALDADSDGEEGRFYVWNAAEFDAVTGADAPLARARFGVREVGDLDGATVLHLAAPLADVAAAHGLAEDAARERLGTARAKLLAARDARTRPGLDDKVLASWNGLAIAGLAEAARYLRRPDLADAAERAAAFLRAELWREGDDGAPGRLLHTWHADVGARVDGLLEDYADVGLGLLELYRTRFDPRWLSWAIEIGAAIVARFRDPDGGFFSTPEGGEALIVRPKELFDAATPAASNAAALLLLRLARLTGRSEWEAAAVGAVVPLADAVASQPTGFATAMLALEEASRPPREVLVAGPAGRDDTEALLAELARPLPFTALARVDGTDDAAGDPVADVVPWAAGRGRVASAAAAYVCEGGTCRLPVTDAEALRAALDARATSGNDDGPAAVG